MLSRRVCGDRIQGFHTLRILLSSQPSKVAKFSLKKSRSQGTNSTNDQSSGTSSVRTRFAPSPTGFLHLGSLRTALYNYLLARATNGQFLLRIEDTDQTRLVPGAKDNIYETLSWLGMSIDEGPNEGGPYGPYIQSERSEIYSKYSDELLEKGLAYRCFCPKERLNDLRDSARKLKPPTTVSYDRHCFHHISREESDKLANDGNVPFTLRFKCPDKYPEFVDLLHGRVNHQPQVNSFDVRYDDPILMKSDGLPTYHFANVIDDHLMKVTHVVRGEEWLASTAKHIALYDAFGWDKPSFIHIPLLTTVDDKKLSKRSGDIDILSLKSQGYLAESLVNFSVLFGWSPKRGQGEKSSELFTLKELEKNFRLDGLTTGNAKVVFNKLDHFNKEYLGMKLKDDEDDISKQYVAKVLKGTAHTLMKLSDLYSKEYSYFFTVPTYSKINLLNKTKLNEDVIKLVLESLSCSALNNDISPIAKEIGFKIEGVESKNIFQILRYAISGDQSGIKLPTMISIIGEDEVKRRIQLLLNLLA
ncbi:hypothetical protein CANARDRAFT_174785 [[Candida] arabinofermentans NRRL YB-2248]|uniref:Glutamate--tRNA ligase, mitochondrial n=1 Tax=[Candida] arabinofermentans NRRL YB-2248 TaxID=983967 RepID=A0A1E4T4P1_9ASCO|nr:hypothetical protein CANARDRAFT_174785 [[Candida] arabinofermentans NRRL YB-2248]